MNDNGGRGRDEKGIFFGRRRRLAGAVPSGQHDPLTSAIAIRLGIVYIVSFYAVASSKIMRLVYTAEWRRRLKISTVLAFAGLGRWLTEHFQQQRHSPSLAELIALPGCKN